MLNANVYVNGLEIPTYKQLLNEQHQLTLLDPSPRFSGAGWLRLQTWPLSMNFNREVATNLFLNPSGWWIKTKGVDRLMKTAVHLCV